MTNGLTQRVAWYAVAFVIPFALVLGYVVVFRVWLSFPVLPIETVVWLAATLIGAVGHWQLYGTTVMRVLASCVYVPIFAFLLFVFWLEVIGWLLNEWL
jgi:hypothetical protein